MPLSRRLLTAPARFFAVLARGRAANSTANKTTASKTTAAVAAFGVFMASVIVAVAFGGGNGPTPPVQRWGSAAGRTHRVPASATMARLVNGRVVYPAASRGSAGHVTAATELPPSRRPRGAVPATPPVPRLRLPERGTGRPEQVRPARQPAAPTVGGFDRSTSRAVPKNSSADTTAYQNADGTRTEMIYQTPVNYRTPGGSWAPIDTSLAPAGGSAPAATVTASPVPPLTSLSTSPAALATQSTQPAAPLATPPASPPAGPTPPRSPAAPATSGPPGGGWAQRAVADPASFAPYGDARPLVRLALDGSHTLGFALQGAAHTAGAVKENSVAYAGVRAAADLSFTAGAGLIKERLTLRSAAAPSTWVFPLTLSGVRAAAGPGGGIQFAAATGQVLAVVPHGFMTDSAVNPRSGDGARSDGVSYSLVMLAGQPAIKMTLDTAWLDAKNRVFPVTVDPSVSATNSNGTTYVMSSGAGDNSGGPEIKVGTWDGGTDVAKSFLKFDGVSSSLQNENVLGAVLGVFNSWSYSCSPRPVQVYPVTSSWSVTGSKSWPGPSTGAAIARMNFATGWVPLGSTTSPCPASWKGFGLGQAGTNLINGWTHGTIANNGLALGASGSDSYGWKKFTSINNPPGQPFLSITYTPYGATYKLASAKPVTQVWPNQNGVLAIKVTNTGAATWTPTNGFELSYVAYNAARQQVASHPVFTPMPATVAPGQTVTVNAKVNAQPPQRGTHLGQPRLRRAQARPPRRSRGLLPARAQLVPRIRRPLLRGGDPYPPRRHPLRRGESAAGPGRLAAGPGHPR